MKRDQQVAEIRAALAVLAEPGQVVELRAPGIKGKGKRTDSGYFDNLDTLAIEAARLDNMQGVHGVYVTLNPIVPDLLARAANRVEPWAQETTADTDVTRRRWLPIDTDPVRKAGISSTDDEHAAALERAASIRAWLAARGWREPVTADSGNGSHLLYRIDLPNDAASTDLAQRCLAALASQFDDERVKVDRTVYNAARIWKLYGTTARKGDNTASRPHRRARLLDVPAQMEVVTVDQLRDLAALAPAAAKPSVSKQTAAKTTTKRAADCWQAATAEAVEDWARAAGLSLGTRRSFDGNGHKWSVDCLTSTEHKDGAALLLNGDGYLNYKCSHDSCSSRTIVDVFRTYPPPAVVAHRNGTNGAGYEHAYTGNADTLEEQAASDTGSRTTRRPIIETNAQLSTMVDHALAAIRHANESDPRRPVLLVRGGVLVRLKTDENGRTISEPVNSGALLGILSRVAIWIKTTEAYGKEKEEEAVPPSTVVQALLHAGEWPGMPVLDGIVYAPTFTRGGRLHTERGYDHATRLFNAGSVQLGDTTPTAENVRAARALVFDDLLPDFPFADDASRAHAMALYLLPFVRRMIDGPTVMHMATAPAAGTGKTLMISMALFPALGEVPEPITVSPDPSELGKVITTKVLEGPPYLFFDNISGKLDNAALAAALTSTRRNDRLLSTNTTISGKVDWVWAGTANNPTISEELTRRAVLIRLDAGMEQPDRRTGFKHANIVQWAKEHRDELVTAAIVLVRNWLENAGGRRWHGRAKGSFEQWAEIMGGILDAASEPGFLANDDELREQAAPETADLRAFVAAWTARFGKSPVTVKMLMPIASTVEDWTEDDGGKRALVKSGDDLLGNMLGDGTPRSRETRLGFVLAEHKDRVFGEWRIVEADRDPRSKSRMWKVTPARPTYDDSAERCGTLRNVDEPETANVPRLSTTGDLAFREVSRNVAERLEQFNAQEEKTAITDTPGHDNVCTYVGTPANVPQRSAEFRENLTFPVVDSARNVGGQTFRNVPQNEAERSAGGLDGYLARDLTPAELAAALSASNTAGVQLTQLPAGGGLWRVNLAPATNGATGVRS